MSEGQIEVVRSFQVKTVGDMIDKLGWEIDQLIGCQNSIGLNNVCYASYHAINAAITAWHVVDWMWISSNESQRLSWLSKGHEERRKIKQIVQFQLFMKDACPELSICQHIANSSKHLKDGKYTDKSVETCGPEFVTVKATAGTLRAGEPIATHTTWLMIRSYDGKRTAKSVFENVYEFLFNFAVEEGLIDKP